RTSNGRPWLERQCASIAEAGLTHATLVLGFDAEAYAPLLAAGTVAGLRVASVRNGAPERGPFSSLVSALSVDDSAAFVLPIDVRDAGASVWAAVDEALTTQWAAVPVYDGHGGHPVLLASAFIRHLAFMPLDDEAARLDHQVRALPDGAVVRLPVNDD